MRKQILLILVFLLCSINSFAMDANKEKNIIRLNYRENQNFTLTKSIDFKDTKLWLFDKKANNKILITDSIYEYNFDLYSNGNVIFVSKEKEKTFLNYFNYQSKTASLLKTPAEYDIHDPLFINENKICYLVADRPSHDPYPGYLFLNDIIKNNYQQMTFSYTGLCKIYKDYIIFEQDSKRGTYLGIFMIDCNSLKKVKISNIGPSNIDMYVLKNNILELQDANARKEIINLDKVISENFK